uniref:Translin-associated protein X n=2 Tax=Parascaris univalens TaxID=6257 RepID=A0A915AWK7_PARUN
IMESTEQVGDHGMARSRKRSKQQANPDCIKVRSDSIGTNHINEHDREQFLCYRQEMDDRNDRYERLVKLSRDITIESKRIIFQLHRYTAAKTDAEKEDLLKKAELRLDDLRQKQFFAMAKELLHLDQNLYNRAVTFGLQEYIEAWSFYTFIAKKDLLRIGEVADGLRFEKRDDEGKTIEKCFVEVSAMDYLLGLSDLGGELMRFAINQVAADHRAPNQVANFMRNLYAYYLLLDNMCYNKDYADKLRVLRASLMKVEYELYSLKVRSNEVPAEMMADYMSLFAGGMQQASSGPDEQSRPSYY